MTEENFILTDSQQGLDVKLRNFLNGTDRIFLLIGKPGVGKTTMTKICLSELIDKDIKYSNRGANINVAGITLSHQAKNVLGEHIPNVFTYASAFGMKEVIREDGYRSFEYNKWQEELPIGECAIPVFVHDEVSQYTQEMLEIVLERTPIFSKLILMGDKGQLPPIDSGNKMKTDADSPVFDLELPDECKHELTERVRQSKGNPILDLSDLIREEIFGEQNINRVLEAIREPKINDDKGYGFIRYGELNEHLKDKDQLRTCVIAFRNKTVSYFNKEIRAFLLDNPTDEIIKDDIICMLDNYYHKEADDVISYKLHNSDTFKLSRVFTKFVRYSDGDKVHRIQVYVASIVGERNKKLIVPTPAGRLELEKALEIISTKCKERKMKWEVFWNFKKKFCNCSYGYAITAYKSQGSTYDSVYVDINDILLTKPLTPKRKLQTIYTAITRAKNDVYFLKART